MRRDEVTDALLRDPAMTDRPGFRWWWQTPLPTPELLRELRAIVDAGFGEVEIGFSRGFWGDEAQRDALAAVLTEAEALGVGVAVTLGAEWPLRTPNTTTGTPHAAQELQYGVVHVADGREPTVDLPRPFDEDASAPRPTRLLAVVAGRVLRRGGTPTVVQVTSWAGLVPEVRGPETSTILDAGSLCVLTDDVHDGVLGWTPREGTWAVFALWLRDARQGATSFLDRAAALAATEYLDEHQFGPVNAALLHRAGTELFEDSLELNADSLFWSPDLSERFLARHGYDPTPYLPVLFAHGMCRYWVPNEEPVPDVDLDSGAGARIRRDYYRLITDLYITDHLLLLQEWSETHGLAHKAQVAYGQNLEPVRSNREFVRHGGRAEGESLNSGDRAPVDPDHPTWRFALDWQRSVVGGAHQGGATRISTELGAQFATTYAQTLGDLKQVLDKEWASGITKPYVHGFASQEPDAPWPTQSRFGHFVTESWNDTHFPEWANWRPLTDYWARGTVVLETGIPRTDVAVHRDGFLTTAARGLPDADATAPRELADLAAFEDAGFTVQFLDPIGLTEPDAVAADGTLFPDGPGYRALVVDERTLTPDAAEALDVAASRGLRVVFVGDLPDADSGFAAGPAGDARVRAAVARAVERPGVLRVPTMSGAAGGLLAAGLAPRAAGRSTARGVLTQWRDAGSIRFVLVYNPATQPCVVDLSLEGTGRVDEVDLVAGTVRPIAHHGDGERTGVRLDLAGLGLRVVRLDLSREPGGSPEEPTLDEVALDGWHLTVETEEPTGSRTIALPGQGPGDWRGIEALRDVSGVGRYTVRVRDHDPADLTHTLLHLGGLAGSASVAVGGRHLGTAYVSGTTLDLGDALASGDELVIEVRTCLRNAVVASGMVENVPAVTVAHGLLGPVRLGSVRPPTG